MKETKSFLNKQNSRPPTPEFLAVKINEKNNWNFSRYKVGSRR